MYIFCRALSQISIWLCDVIFRVYFNFPANECKRYSHNISFTSALENILIFSSTSLLSSLSFWTFFFFFFPFSHVALLSLLIRRFTKEIYALHRVNNAVNMMFFYTLLYAIDGARFKQLYNFVNSDIFFSVHRSVHNTHTHTVKKDNLIRTHEWYTKREYVILVECVVFQRTSLNAMQYKSFDLHPSVGFDHNF